MAMTCLFKGYTPLRILYHFKCGHARDFYVGHFLCPICQKSRMTTIEYTCKICGTHHETRAASIKCLKYSLCPKCRKQYTGWRKRNNGKQTFVDWLFDRQLKKRGAGGTYNEIKKDVSPCLGCEHVARDKDKSPCNDCIRIKAWAAME